MSIQELLSLPSDVMHPNAYQLFGLELGESDASTIEGAINQRIASLKQAKASAEPETWKRAAAAVVAAQKTLKDPQAKAELDASFGIINEPSIPATPAGSSASDDPLASLLPPSASGPSASGPSASGPSASGPSASGPSASGPSAAASPAMPQAFSPPSMTEAAPDLGATVQDRASDEQAATLAAPSNAAPDSQAAAHSQSVAHSNAASPAAPLIRRRTPVRRRRSWGGLIFGSLVLALLGTIVVGLGYFYMTGPGKVEIVKTNDGYQIKTGGQSSTAPLSATPREPIPTPTSQSDGIMKAPPVRANPGQSIADDMRADESGIPAGEMGMPPGDAPMADQTQPDSPASPNNPVPTPEPTPSSSPEPTPSPSPEPGKPPTAESISIGQAAIDKAREAIRAADWDLMKPLAGTAESAAVTPEQKQLAETIFQYADLATFYRGAVTRAVPALSFGQEIQITETMKAMVQEADENHLTINRGKDGSGKPQLKSFPINEIPLILAHALAPYQLDIDSPEGQAAKAAYQAIGPFATAGRRSESIEILRGLQKVEGADPKRLADFLVSLGG